MNSLKFFLLGIVLISNYIEAKELVETDSTTNIKIDTILECSAGSPVTIYTDSLLLSQPPYNLDPMRIDLWRLKTFDTEPYDYLSLFRQKVNDIEEYFKTTFAKVANNSTIITTIDTTKNGLIYHYKDSANEDLRYFQYNTSTFLTRLRTESEEGFQEVDFKFCDDGYWKVTSRGNSEIKSKMIQFYNFKKKVIIATICE